MDPRIRPVGHWFPTAPDGTLQNTADLARLPDEWHPALDQIVAAYQADLGPALHSVWVRGSAVRGTAVSGVSDLDTLALATLPPASEGALWLDRPSLGPATAAITAPGCTEIEVCVASESVGLHHRRGAFLRFLLATQSTRVLGPPLTHSRYRVGPEIAFAARHLASTLQTARREAAEPRPPDDRKSLVRWTAKTVVRAGLDLVMTRHGRYSRDLWPCYTAFIQYYPEHQTQMAQALSMALFPDDDLTTLLPLLDDLGPWLVDAVTEAGLA